MVFIRKGEDMSSIAIITARGGSKRIPRKNIKEFCGKPIIAYSIEAAIKSELFDEVMVSTDDEEIKEIAIKYGAKVPFMRSEKTSNDYATTQDVLFEVLEEYKKMGQEFDYLCCLYPTAPFVTAEKLKKSMQMLEETNCDTVIPVVSFSFPPQRAFVINDNQLKYHQPENALARSQDLQTMYHDCGQYYCLNVARFIEEKKMVMENVKPIIESELEVQDIDNEMDWQLAELKYKLLTKSV